MVHASSYVDGTSRFSFHGLWRVGDAYSTSLLLPQAMKLILYNIKLTKFLRDFTDSIFHDITSLDSYFNCKGYLLKIKIRT